MKTKQATEKVNNFKEERKQIAASSSSSSSSSPSPSSPSLSYFDDEASRPSARHRNEQENEGSFSFPLFSVRSTGKKRQGNRASRAKFAVGLEKAGDGRKGKHKEPQKHQTKTGAGWREVCSTPWEVREAAPPPRNPRADAAPRAPTRRGLWKMSASAAVRISSQAALKPRQWRPGFRRLRGVLGSSAPRTWLLKRPAGRGAASRARRNSPASLQYANFFGCEGAGNMDNGPKRSVALAAARGRARTPRGRHAPWSRHSTAGRRVSRAARPPQAARRAPFRSWKKGWSRLQAAVF